MKRVKEMQYENLRCNFNHVLDEVVGDCYYNNAMDVYTCDEMACQDIVATYKQMKTERNTWRAGFILSCIVFGILLVI